MPSLSSTPKTYHCSVCDEAVTLHVEGYHSVYKFCYRCSSQKHITENSKMYGDQLFRKFNYMSSLATKGSFGQFLSEKSISDKKDFNILICTAKSKTDENGYHPSTKVIIDECEKMGIKYSVIFPEDYFVNVSEGKLIFNEFKGNKKVVVDPENTVAIMRGGIINTANGKNIYQALEVNGVFTVNSMKAMETCSNKWATYRVLLQNKIPTPRSFLLTKNEDSIAKGMQSIGGKFPVIVKTLQGAEGIGISIIESEQSLKGVLQTLWSFNAELLLQEYLPIDGDLRIIVLDGKVIATMKRNKMQKDFRSNASLGATTSTYKLSKEEEELAIKTAQKLNCYYAGIDMFNVKGKLYVVEVNTSPGSKGITETSGVNVISKLIDYLSKKENWKHSSYLEVGYVEKITLSSGNATIFTGDAKLDTGNGIRSSLHGDDIVELNGGRVSFKINGIKHTLPIETKSTVLKHQRQIEDKRIIIKLDLKLGDREIKGVEFGLTNRQGSIKELEPALLSREIITKMRMVVVPDKKHLLSESKKRLS